MSEHEEYKLEHTPFSSPQTDKTCDTKAVPLNLPLGDTNYSELHKGIGDVAKKLQLNSEEIKTLTRFMESAFNGQWRNGRYNAIIERIKDPASCVTIDDHKLRIAHPKLAAKDEDGRLTGKAAIMFVSATAGVGKTTKIPLYQSGIVATLGLFDEDKLLELQVQLAERRVEVGRRTRGAIFSSDDSYLITTIVDFILRHVVDCTVKTSDADRVSVLRKLILVPDVATLIVGALADIYPNGYPYVAVCMSPECTYKTITEAKDGEIKYPSLDFKRMAFVDPSRVTPEVAKFMAVKMGTHTVEEVKEFQRTHLVKNKVTAPLNDKGDAVYKLELCVPNYDDYRAVSVAWLEDVTSAVDRALTYADASTDTAEANRRSNYINNRLNLYAPLRSGCWIKAIVINVAGGDEPLRIEGTDDIYECMKTLCKQSDVKRASLDAIEEYKIESIYTYTGIGKHNCPKCNTEQQVDRPSHPEIIPVNVVSYFFDIMGWKIVESYI